MTHPSADQTPVKTDDDKKGLKPAPADDARDANPADNVDRDADPHVDRQLDKGLKETFPASDPVSINPGAD
jgi:hypothetical protein